MSRALGASKEARRRLSRRDSEVITLPGVTTGVAGSGKATHRGKDILERNERLWIPFPTPQARGSELGVCLLWLVSFDNLQVL